MKCITSGASLFITGHSYKKFQAYIIFTSFITSFPLSLFPILFHSPHVFSHLIFSFGVMANFVLTWLDHKLLSSNITLGVSMRMILDEINN